MRAMLARGVRFIFIYTGGVGHRMLDVRQFHWAFGAPARSEQVSVQLWPECDHLFYRPSDRERLLSTLAGWLPRA
jgi:hypothetical protein